LSELAQLSKDDFLAEDDNFAITEHHLRIAVNFLHPNKIFGWSFSHFLNPKKAI
jgi:hypothetical protein